MKLFFKKYSLFNAHACTGIRVNLVSCLVCLFTKMGQKLHHVQQNFSETFCFCHPQEEFLEGQNVFFLQPPLFLPSYSEDEISTSPFLLPLLFPRHKVPSSDPSFREVTWRGGGRRRRRRRRGGKKGILSGILPTLKRNSSKPCIVCENVIFTFAGSVAVLFYV